MLYGLRGKRAYILHGHKGIVTSLSAQKGIYRSILSLIGLGHTSCVAIGLGPDNLYVNLLVLEIK